MSLDAPVLAQNVFGVGIGGGRSWKYFGPGQYIGDFCDGCEVNILGSVACEHNGRKMRRSFTPKQLRRSCRATIVAMSIDVGQVLCRKLRQVGEGTLGRRGRYFPTVAWLTSTPSLSSSRWMRGASQSGLARLIWRIRSRIAVLILGRPGRRDRHRQ